MSNVVIRNNSDISIAEKFGFSESQLDLVKRTVAKNATDDELELFFYRCKELQLNPLMPGQVYFIKFKNRKTGEWNPGSIVIGIDGFRSRASRTGKLSGIKRGVIRNDKGQCVGGWADVYRSDWTHPAHEEVPLNEYIDTYKDTWRNMPETMIKKVAEVAALRMAFPDDLAGLYLREEFDQAERPVKDVTAESSAVVPAALPSPASKRKPTENQLKRLFAIARSSGTSQDDLKRMLSEKFALTTTKDLDLDQYNQLCDSLLDPSPPPDNNTEQFDEEISDSVELS